MFEVALIPGMVVGVAAVLAPRFLPGSGFLPKNYLPRLGGRPRPLFNSTVRRRSEPAVSPLDRPDDKAPPAAPAGLRITQAVAKTITFLIIVTTPTSILMAAARIEAPLHRFEWLANGGAGLADKARM